MASSLPPCPRFGISIRSLHFPWASMDVNWQWTWFPWEMPRSSQYPQDIKQRSHNLQQSPTGSNIGFFTNSFLPSLAVTFAWQAARTLPSIHHHSNIWMQTVTATRLQVSSDKRWPERPGSFQTVLTFCQICSSHWAEAQHIKDFFGEERGES
jgi:hypothetical protein